MINELTRKNAHTELDHIFKTILPAHGMTERPEQIRLSHTMLDAMFENRIALSDAGTGIGKTYAYLTAAIVYSHSRLVDGLPFQPVIIATSSIALQNAIVREYLPFLSDALSDDPHITTPILAALRKGKSHYVCDERLRQHLQQRPNGKNVMQKKELYSLRDVLDLDETQKLSSFDRERVCVPQFCDCKHPDCRYRRHLTECGQKRYLFQICNQNLWLADCMHRENGLKPILPDACTVIVDEAHTSTTAARLAESMDAEPVPHAIPSAYGWKIFKEQRRETKIPLNMVPNTVPVIYPPITPIPSSESRPYLSATTARELSLEIEKEVPIAARPIWNKNTAIGSAKTAVPRFPNS